jgi:TatD DNase family protein
MFGGSVDQAERYLSLGYYISFSGIITFKNSGTLPDVAKIVPLERILVETDSPLVTPEPHRGQRNEPAFVEFMVRKIAEVRGLSVEEISQITEENAKKLFRLDF